MSEGLEIVVERLQWENYRLREALRRIAQHEGCGYTEHDRCGCIEDPGGIKEIAGKALVALSRTTGGTP